MEKRPNYGEYSNTSLLVHKEDVDLYNDKEKQLFKRQKLLFDEQLKNDTLDVDPSEFA